MRGRRGIRKSVRKSRRLVQDNEVGVRRRGESDVRCCFFIYFNIFLNFLVYVLYFSLL
jgi:hypothetical protein